LMPPNEKYLLENFLLSAESWQKIYDYQKGLCGVCHQPLVENKTYTEHAHDSGQVRGITCFRCNAAIREYFTVEFVAAILEYLKYPPATAALGRPHYGLAGRVGTKTRRALIKKLRKSKITP
jgi:hypothetical protein